MDSKDSHSGGRDGSSSSSSESGSPRRRSPASSPSSVNRKSPRSDKRSEPNSPDPYWRSDSPKRKIMDPRSPSPESGDNSPAPRRPHTPDAPKSPGSDTNQTSRSKWSTKSEVGSERHTSLSPNAPPLSAQTSPSIASSLCSPKSPRSPQNASPRPQLTRSPDSPKRRSVDSPRHSSPTNLRDRSASPKRNTLRSPSSQRSFGNRSPAGPRSPSSRDASPRSSSSRHRSPRSPRYRSSSESPRKTRRSRSDSSRSSRGSSPRRARDPPTEEISDGEMDFEHDKPHHDEDEGKADEKNSSREKDVNNISHEDLSDVSDLDSMGHGSDDDKKTTPRSPIRAPDESSNHSVSRSPRAGRESKLNGKVVTKSSSISPPKISNGSASNLDAPKLNKIPQEKTSKTEDVEEQLDFEAEEGECVEAPTSKQNNTDKHSDAGNKEDGEEGGASSLEEGEVSDEEERRPEETEPRPVCRFYSRGQCTWGVSCRFLHPGVTDKGNYTMFDMVRAMPPGYGGPPLHHPPHAAHPMHPAHAVPPSAAAAHQLARESAWERGLRTAKEMMRKATKRKEQDSDFEEKKMHLSLAGSGRGGSLGPEEDDPELAAYAGYPPASPTHGAAHHPGLAAKREREREDYYRLAEREEYYRMVERRQYYEESPRYFAKETGRYPRKDVPTHEESPPPYYDKGPEHPHHKSRRGRTTREVIVQRARVETTRGDEWADPWMRGGKRGQPGSNEKRRRGKYTSASSYSSSSSSDSSSRSSSRSPSPGRHRRPAKSPPPRQRSGRAALSPSVIVQERRAANARALAMNPPAPTSRKRPPSPAASRQHAANPPPPPKGVDAFGRTKPPKVRSRKRYSKSSSSGSDSSSSSSDSDSDSHSSSSSGSSVPPASAPSARSGPPAVIPPSTRQIRQETKTSLTVQKKEIDGKDSLAKKRAATSPIGNIVPTKKPVSRREELLKQLKAVEDAIARKRSKV